MLEQRLWDYFVLNRAEWHAAFVDSVRAMRMPGYLKVPREQLLVVMGKSMNLMLEAIRDRALEAYLKVQRENFKTRLAAGIGKEELFGSLDAAWSTMDRLVDAAFPEGPDRQTMRGRVGRYKVATSTLLTEILLSK